LFLQLVVWVDPLDGTSEYTSGNVDHVTVLIGVARNGRPVGGVIHQPYYNFDKDQAHQGRTLWGIPGIGAGGFEALPPPEGKKVVATTRSHMTELVQQSLDALQPDEVLKIGGAGYKVT
jgi:3'(2'), 5'-bisphosphate nucleotidase